MTDFDQAARFGAEAEPEAVVSRVLRPAGVTLPFREWVDTRTTPRPGERDQTADRVAALTDPAAPEQPWLVVLEFQAQPDPDKLDATLVEAAQFRRTLRHGPDRRGKYQVLTALVYLCGTCPEEELDMTLPSGHGTHHRPLIWNVAEDSAAAALAEVEGGQASWGLLFWISLMAGAAEPAIIERWKTLLPTVPERHRGNLVQIALIFAELAGCYLAWEKGLEGWNMMESQVVKRWVERGELKNARHALVQVLTARFPGQVPAEVLETIEQQPSLPMLEDWLTHAAVADSLDDFIKVLRR